MSLNSQAPLDLERLLRHDATRLTRQWARIQRVSSERIHQDLQRWQAALESSYARFDQRLKTPYRIDYDPELPIYNHRQEILEILANRQTMIVCGETGSGKSTQLPKLCLQAGLFRHGWIGHTQPRRLAARSIANRLAQELDTELGQVVGYKIRFQDRTQESSLVKLMTDGILLAEIQRDPLLEAYECIIVDEAHERSIQIDMLMAYLAELVHRRPELRLIITSATIDAQRFSERFYDTLGPAPILSIQGRSYPVEIRYRGIQSLADAPVIESDSAQLDRLCMAVDELFSEGRGDILAFFPSERDIRDASRRLRGHLTHRGLESSVEVLPLYARLTEAEQQRVFQPHRQTRIVLATNVAESSLTVPGIRYVIDTGTARVSRYAPRSRVQRLPIEPICQASANQRSGRCGRLGPGIAIRLYDQSDYLARAGFTQPEIMRCDLAATILHAKSLRIDDIESLAWLDPPRPESIREGLQTLREIEAIDDSGSLTRIGRTLSNWPVSPRIGRMLLAAHENGCLHEMLIIASALETQDPRVRPPEFQQAADEAHKRFKDNQSDFVTLLRIWDFYQSLREKLGRSRLEKACRDSFLSLVRLREWGDVHRQLLEQCREAGLTIQSRRIAVVDHEQPEQQNPTREKFSDGYAPL
ncbi:MAG: ATP-dependent helicase HrpB, partial [Planctomycetota bacterium]